MKNKIEIYLNHNRPYRRSKLDRRGMTLVELLAVIAIIGILAAILIFTISSMRTKANRAVAASNLRNLGQASQLYTIDHKDQIFPSYSTQWGPSGSNFLYWDQFLPFFYASQNYGIMVTPGDDLIQAKVPNQLRFRKADARTGNQVTYYSYARSVELPKPSSSTSWIDAPARLSHLENPARTMLLIETGQNSVMYHNYDQDYFRFDNSGKTLAAFVDGHVKSVDRENVLRLTAPSTWSAEKKLFWFGFSNAVKRQDY